MGDLSGVSIIVCCHNSSPRLKQTLLHISKQKISGNINCEVIIVDNASNDNTATVATNEWSNLNAANTEFKVAKERTPGLSNARKRGIEEAQYEYLVFCDDDNWLNDDYVSTVFDFFNTHPDVAILGGIGEPVFDMATVVPAWFNTFYSSYAIGPQAKQSSNDLTLVYGAGMAIRKSLFDNLIFKTAPLLIDRSGKNLTAGGDSEICFKAKLSGYKIAYMDGLKFKHYIPIERLSWAYLRNLHRGFAQSFIPIRLYERALNTTKLKLPFFYWLKNMLYYFAIYVKYWPKHFRAYSKSEGTPEEIHHITWRAIAVSYLSYNFKTVAIYKQIIAYKSIGK